ncbi:FkbM family methyltransferase [Methylobacterium fujisawaense]|uniref:FkbM family methyltransferase n=1 Tax=Methylobacterium fujisawaense TaxID=107400 RepID=UPI002F358235
MKQYISDNQIFIGYPFSELDIMRRFLASDQIAEDGFHKDGFGNKARIDFFVENGAGGTVQTDVPFPDNGQYGEAIEYLGTLRGAQAAGDQLTVYELGAGFAPWLVVAEGFRRALGRPARARYVAVEADPARLALIRQNFDDNGLTHSGAAAAGIETAIINAAVAPEPGELHFSAQSILDWGGAPTSDAGAADYRGLSGSTVAVPARRIDDLIEAESRVELLHIDIQGWEYRSLAASIEAVDAKVACMVIGTHSRVIEGQLLALLREWGWLIVYEKPCKFDCNVRLPDLVGSTVFDGTQFWINPKMWPDNFDWA